MKNKTDNTLWIKDFEKRFKNYSKKKTLLKKKFIESYSWGHDCTKKESEEKFNKVSTNYIFDTIIVYEQHTMKTKYNFVF